jgi:hypothetical protein
MNAEIASVLSEYRNCKIYLCRGVTHTNIRIECDNQKISKPGFVVDVFVNRRTQEISVARIDTRDEKILRRVCAVISHFQF